MSWSASALALSDTVPVLEALLYSNCGAIMTSKHICSNKMMFSLFTWDNPDGSRSKSSGSADSSMVCERACNRSCSVDVVVALYGIALTMAMAGVSFVVGFIPAVGVRPTVAVANRGVSFSGGRDSSTRFSVAFGRAGNFWSSSFWMISRLVRLVLPAHHHFTLSQSSNRPNALFSCPVTTLLPPWLLHYLWRSHGWLPTWQQSAEFPDLYGLCFQRTTILHFPRAPTGLTHYSHAQ
jgi:hypothetical protein